MLNTLINTFTKGDLVGLKSKLLHSTCWAQHNAKAFGEDKLQSIPLNWLTLAGRCKVESSKSITDGKHQVINLSLLPESGQNRVNYTFWLETNGQVIKSVNAVVDTMQLAFSRNQTPDKIKQQLPQPDAFVIQDYDQQDHLQDEIAKPSNIASLDNSMAKALDTWWSIWSKAQLSAINDIYQPNAEIILPAAIKSAGLDELFNFVLDKFNRLTRNFCQLETIAIEGNKVALKWFLDGDENGSKIRAPFMTILTLDNGKIIEEITTSDILAYINRFPESALFNCESS
jgi:hypothetical protein